MVGEGIGENLREGILYIGPVHFLVPAMLAEGQLRGEPVVIGIFVVDGNDAFPITIVGHTKQSLVTILFLCFSFFHSSTLKNPKYI